MWNSRKTDTKSNEVRPAATGNQVQPHQASQPSAPPVVTAPLEKQSQTATVGKSVHIKGQVTGSEDLVVDGQIEGDINLPGFTLTVGPNATVKAGIQAKGVIVFGSVVGTVKADDKAEIRKSGSVEGDLVAGRIAIQEGAHYQGKVDMGYRRAATQSTEDAKKDPVAV